ncbi:MAG: hypothetical protein KatS3mg104_0209 [Phycisphaerae bacterium]|jgi:hypothetical protein|nr:MAG: hypothetical protein KatS3mg104_0209 [Phycisphaerae bacterium]
MVTVSSTGSLRQKSYGHSVFSAVTQLFMVHVVELNPIGCDDNGPCKPADRSNTGPLGNPDHRIGISHCLVRHFSDQLELLLRWSRGIFNWFHSEIEERRQSQTVCGNFVAGPRIPHAVGAGNGVGNLFTLPPLPSMAALPRASWISARNSADHSPHLRSIQQ